MRVRNTQPVALAKVKTLAVDQSATQAEIALRNQSVPKAEIIAINRSATKADFFKDINRFFFAIIIGLASFGIFAEARAQPVANMSQPAQQQLDKNFAYAKWLLERLSGVKWPKSSPLLQEMTDKITKGDAAGAAQLAIETPQFYSVTVKEMAARMSTREETIREPLNDFSATIIGVTRDEIDARQLLYGDFYYAGDLEKPIAGVSSKLYPDILGSNKHYAELESKTILKESLKKIEGQIIATGSASSRASPDPAGVLTSRAFLEAHAIAGTNRRIIEYTFREFMCVPIEDWADTGASDIRIGRDIDRAPAGEPENFLTSCKGCHTVMDGFRGAFARWDFSRGVKDLGSVPVHSINHGLTLAKDEGSLKPDIEIGGRNRTMEANRIMKKMIRVDFAQYEGGYISTDDSFVNNATRGFNSTLFGWRGMAPDSSSLSDRTTGAHAFGRLVANSKRFSQCLAKRVWQEVCRHDLPGEQFDALLVSLGAEFEKQNYKMKNLFAVVATHPKCRL